ncbi:MAG TPA: sulfotransferase, partial [Erythrobacter sp.]|nr:sulfotransferase [Erythrobacter sp.]
IVVGQMRAGTTRLHRLLAADPAHCGTPLYRALDPVQLRVDLRPVKTVAGLALARRINPWLDTLHPFGARQVDEEIAWLSHALIPAALEAQYRIPSYIAASEARDAVPAYAELARTLRTEAALSGTARIPRVLKCPQYAEDLAVLLHQFPDARVVVARRDHDAVLASTVSVVASQMVCQSDHADLAAIEREWRRKIALREKRMAQGLAQFAGPVAEVDFRALDTNWHGEMERVYRLLGLDLSGKAQAAMARLQRAARRSPHRQHQPLMRQVAEV